MIFTIEKYNKLMYYDTKKKKQVIRVFKWSIQRDQKVWSDLVGL